MQMKMKCKLRSFHLIRIQWIYVGIYIYIYTWKPRPPINLSHLPYSTLSSKVQWSLAEATGFRQTPGLIGKSSSLLLLVGVTHWTFQRLLDSSLPAIYPHCCVTCNSTRSTASYDRSDSFSFEYFIFGLCRIITASSGTK